LKRQLNVIFHQLQELRNEAGYIPLRTVEKGMIMIQDMEENLTIDNRIELRNFMKKVWS
jgi:hypothetical protein